MTTSNSPSPRDAVIVGAVRTPRGRGKAGKGALAGVHSQELLAQALNTLRERTPFSLRDVDDVVIGCVSQVGEQGANVARNAVLTAGWPEEISAFSLNRFCASGLQAVALGAMGVMSGVQRLVVAGGVESMSRIPMGSDGAAQDGHNQQLRKRLFQVPQGISADLIATLEGFSRADVDALSLESQRRAAAAMAEGRFARSLFGVRDPATGSLLLDKDELPRPTTMEGLARLEPSFAAMGAMPAGPNGESFDDMARVRYGEVSSITHVHTAGNSSGLADGAGAILIASREYAEAHGLPVRARIRAIASSGSEPVIMLKGPIPSTEKALRAAGMSPGDIDLWEINEAFAAVVLSIEAAFKLDHAKVNVNGGAIALGHPLGATGAMLVGTAVDELERAGLGTAAVTMCIGGGQGVTVILERL
jgi:acetyl-CoA C-acetyltransferase